MSQFPNAIPTYDPFTTPITLQALQHTSRHSQMEDDIAAIATKVGIDGSADTSSLDYMVAQVMSDLTTAESTLNASIASLDTEVNDRIDDVLDGTEPFSAPDIPSFANAQHDHEDAAGGGNLETEALAAHAATRATTIFDEVAGAVQSITVAAGMTDTTNWSAGTFDTEGGDIILFVEFTYWRQTAGNESRFRLVIDGSVYAPNSTGFRQYTNELASHKMISRSLLVTGLAAGSHTLKVQGQAIGSGTLEFDTADRMRITLLELKR